MNKKALVCLSMLALLSIMASTSGTQPYKLIVTTDKEGYTFGDTIIVEVKVLLDSTPIKGAIVGIELRDPNNNPVINNRTYQ